MNVGSGETMKNSDILRILYKNKGRYVSGQEMSDKFGISRAALSKRVQKLREGGNKIEAVTNKGYSLIDVPDEINQDNIYLGIDENQSIGGNIIFLNEVSSTNDYAKKTAKKSDSGTVVIANVQTGGKGRRGRSFQSDEGGLYFTVILKPNVKIEEIPFLTQVTACAVYNALFDFGVKSLIKWPNDIILNGKKLCGILCEMSMEIGMLNYCVVGIGINMYNKFDDELKKTATSLSLENIKISKKELFWKILFYLEKYYKSFEDGKYEDMLKILRTNSNIIGERINIISAEKITKATAIDIDKRGFLQVEYDDGTKDALNYGEISIRKE